MKLLKTITEEAINGDDDNGYYEICFDLLFCGDRDWNNCFIDWQISTKQQIDEIAVKSKLLFAVFCTQKNFSADFSSNLHINNVEEYNQHEKHGNHPT